MLTYTPEAEARRKEVRQWLKDNLPERWFDKSYEMTAAERKAFNDSWPDKLFAGGWICATWPKEYGGKGLSTLEGVVLAEEFANAGAPMRADFFGDTLVGPTLLQWGTEEQKKEFLPKILSGKMRWCQGFSEPNSGSDLASVKTTAVLDGDEWIINGSKTWNTGIHKAKHDLIFARTSGKAGDGNGITAFLTPTKSEGFAVEEMLWTFNMPTDHGRVSMKDVRVPNASIFGGEGRGLGVVQHFFNENRIRQAASSLGAAQFCINESIQYAKERKPFGKPLSSNQGIQFPLVELQTQCEMLRALIHKTAWQMDTYGAFSVSDKVSMCNYWANRLCCESADRAMQVHGGLGYSRHKPFEHIYRHHRRYRITEGAEEIQMRRVAGYLFGFMNQRAPKGVQES